MSAAFETPARLTSERVRRSGAPSVASYRVFGAVLRSELQFPELAEVDATETPRWRLRISDDVPSSIGIVPLGERRIGPEIYSLCRTPSGLRLEYSHAGVFDLAVNGSAIVWYRREDALPELVRSIVLGPALALALELAGLLCLHGSAVALGRQAIVFLGPKHHGKSTLATALTAAGGQLVGDDLIAIAPGPPATVMPGVPSVRLWDDAVSALPLGTLCSIVTRGVKTTASGFAGRAFTQGEMSIAALYILEPVARYDGAPCTRSRLSAAAAAIGLAHQTKLADSLIGMAAAGAQLAAAARLAAGVPVWTLAPVRDLTRLPAVVEQIMAWHGRAGVAEPSAQ